MLHELRRYSTNEVIAGSMFCCTKARLQRGFVMLTDRDALNEGLKIHYGNAKRAGAHFLPLCPLRSAQPYTANVVRCATHLFPFVFFSCRRALRQSDVSDAFTAMSRCCPGECGTSLLGGRGCSAINTYSCARHFIRRRRQHTKRRAHTHTYCSSSAPAALLRASPATCGS